MSGDYSHSLSQDLWMQSKFLAVMFKTTVFGSNLLNLIFLEYLIFYNA